MGCRKHLSLMWKGGSTELDFCMCIFVVISEIKQTHHYCTYGHILLKAARRGSCDCRGLSHRGGRCGGGDQRASLARLRGFGYTGLLGLRLHLGQHQASRRRDGSLHLHRSVPCLLAILNILHAQDMGSAERETYLSWSCILCPKPRLRTK